MAKKKPSIIYFCDPVSDNKDLLTTYRRMLERWMNVPKLKIPSYSTVAVLDKNFDILLFDYGGSYIIGLGRDVIDLIIRHAEDHPSRYYVLTSAFTAAAVNDCAKRYHDLPANIVFGMDELYPIITCEFLDA